MNQLITKRHEYMSEVIAFSKDKLIDGIRRIYGDALKVNRSKRFILRDFQNQLKQVGAWTEDKLREEFTRYVGANQAYIQKLLHNIHVLTIKVFISEHGGSCILDQVPSTDVYPSMAFLKDCYLIIAREIWRKPHLLYDKLDRSDFIKNSRDFEKIVVNGIKRAMRHLVPLDTLDERITFSDESDIEQPSMTTEQKDDDATDSGDESVIETTDNSSTTDKVESKHEDENDDQQSIESLVFEPEDDKRNSKRSSQKSQISAQEQRRSSDRKTIFIESDRIGSHRASSSTSSSYGDSSLSSSASSSSYNSSSDESTSMSNGGSSSSFSNKSHKQTQPKKSKYNAMDAYKSYLKLNHAQYLVNQKKLHRSSKLKH